MARISLQAVCLCVLFLSCPTIQSQEKDTGPDSLVKKLSSPSFRERNRAFQSLRKLNKAAIPALKKGLASEDLEVHHRCRQLLRLAQRTDADIKLDAFVKGDDSIAFVGWEQVKKLLGDSRDSRLLFAEMYRTSKTLLKVIAKDPGYAARNLDNRIYTLSRKAPKLADVRELFFLASSSPNRMGNQTLSRFKSILLDRKGLIEVIKSYHMLLKMLQIILQKQAGQDSTFDQRLSIARQFLFFAPIKEVLKKELKQKIHQKMKKVPRQFTQITSYWNLLRKLGMQDVIEDDLEPYVRKEAQEAVKGIDFYRYYEVLILTNDFKMLNVRKTVLKPAFLAKVKKSLKYMNFVNLSAYQIKDSAKLLDLVKETNDLIRPVFVKRMVAASAGSNAREIHLLFRGARVMGMEDLANDLLKPAATRILLNKIGDGKDLDNLKEAAAFAKLWQLKDVVEAQLEPTIEARSQELASTSNINDLYELTRISRINNPKPAKIDKILRSATFKAIQDLEKGNKDPRSSSFQKLSMLMLKYQMKEGIPLLIRVASKSRLPMYDRGYAIHMVGLLGDEKHISKLTPLLKNKTLVGTNSINSKPIETQLRDISLAAMIHLSGQDIRNYGFDYVEATRQEYRNAPFTCLGFFSEARRQRALKQWQDWQKKQEKAAPYSFKD